MTVIRSLYTATTNFILHPRNPLSTLVFVRMIGGGGGGMGSQANMTFNDLNPIPYWLYGSRGDDSWFDIHPSVQVTIDANSVIHWPGHGKWYNQPVMFSAAPCNGFVTMSPTYYVIGSSITTDTFEVSEVPYTPPGVIPTPKKTLTAGSIYITAWKYVTPGASGGGIIGDQGGPGGPNIGFGFESYPGDCGSCTLGAGGRGGGSVMSGGAIEQFGTLEGNGGYDGTGGGGSGGGMGSTYIGTYGLQAGPSGGGGGNYGECEPELKPFYFLRPGFGGAPGLAGLGGWRGGKGGNGSVLIKEYIPEGRYVQG